MRKLLKFLLSRIVIVSALILFQLVLLFLAAVRFTEYFVFYYLLSTVFAVVLTLVIVNRKDGAEYKIAWLVTVLLIPVFGGLLYLIFSGNRMSEHKKKKDGPYQRGHAKHTENGCISGGCYRGGLPFSRFPKPLYRKHGGVPSVREH